VKKILYSLSFVFAIVLYTVSCTKIRTTTLGSDLLPSVDNVTVFDTTLEVTTEFSPLPDSTRISYAADHALGIMQDPSFGKTTGEIYLQLHPAFNSYPFANVPDSLIGLDSVVLTLRYTNVYGDTNSVENIKVFEIDNTSSFRDSSIGYLINTPQIPANNLLAEKNNLLISTLNDSISYVKVKDTVKTSKELRITLPISFGLRLMNLDTSVYRYPNDSLFNLNFKGFAIRADESSPIKKALAYFNLADAGTRLSFHYRTLKSGAPDTTLTEFFFNNRANANLIQRDPTGTEYANKLANGTVNQEELYLQTTPGSYALVKIPGLANLSNRLIYKASLIMDRLPGQEDNNFTDPLLLFLDAIDSTNNRFRTVPNAFVYTGPNTLLKYDPASFGGFLKDNKYEFELARYVQGIVTRKEKSYPLRLYAPYYTTPYNELANGPLTSVINTPVSKGRVIVGGGAHPAKKMRLYIIYSKI
jgi:hypothetical protein